MRIDLYSLQLAIALGLAIVFDPIFFVTQAFRQLPSEFCLNFFFLTSVQIKWLYTLASNILFHRCTVSLEIWENRMEYACWTSHETIRWIYVGFFPSVPSQKALKGPGEHVPRHTGLPRPFISLSFFPSNKTIPHKETGMQNKTANPGSLHKHFRRPHGRECKKTDFFPLLNSGAMPMSPAANLLPSPGPGGFPSGLCVVQVWLSHTMQPLQMNHGNFSSCPRRIHPW